MTEHILYWWRKEAVVMENILPGDNKFPMPDKEEKKLVLELALTAMAVIALALATILKGND